MKVDLKKVLGTLVGVGLACVLLTNGILWNKPKPHVYDYRHPAWKEWVAKYQERGITLVGVYEKPGFMNWAFGTVSIHPIRTNPEQKFRWEWLDAETWREIPPNAITHTP